MVVRGANCLRLIARRAIGSLKMAEWHLEEEPLGEAPLLGHKDALIECPEAVQHPGLLIVR